MTAESTGELTEPGTSGTIRAYGAAAPARRGATDEREELLTWVARHAAELRDASPAPLRRIKVTSGGVTVDVEWSAGWTLPDGMLFPPGPGVPSEAGGSQEQRSSPAAVSPNAIIISAPMVGTFYRAPEPGATPFVEVGDLVDAGQQVGIVEAMKLMNAIQAEHAGRVSEVLASDGTPVEYGAPLIALVPHDAR
jgi:acetyl-CoA carboxylase biotin carboxyl carrier protein